MWNESRRIFALLGDPRVTVVAFMGLLLYGVVLLARRESRSGRVRAVLIIGGATFWLIAATSAIISGDLARWSSFAVFLFAIGVEGRPSPRPSRKPASPAQRSAPASGWAPPACDNPAPHFVDCFEPPCVAADPLLGRPLSS